MRHFFLALVLLTTSAWAIPEKDFKKVWLSEALPYFRSFSKGHLTNAQGMKLRYYYNVEAHHQKNLVISPGRTEPAIKYAELIYDLKDSGFNIFILDHQGQGESERQLKDPHKGHVIYFSDYVRDFTQFINEIVTPHSKQETYLIAHSMGGAIAIHFMGKYPEYFTKAVLSAPMLELDTAPYTEAVARVFSEFLVLTKQGSKYAPDRGPYIPEEDTFEKNDVTQSLVRFEANKFLFTRYPYLTLGGPTARWVNQSLKATKSITSLAPKIKTPILLFQAGKDLVVKPNRQNSFCMRGNCELITYPESFHEILQEKDSIRDEALREIRIFLGF